ncbi:Hypothetical protein MIP_03790 [Mycobacterium intracellulare subsp. intracellulare MTCC 9506]|uniref:DUF222 domain-containing protein n=1 Tax=Mycobacterium indicus pranii (strain DSM 45239 / MTCC 9506) TaxID=1232724 RepID=J9WH20_MYCIP|nr:Hypothetical protein MIP_03790 [Mycobacterium intracellulare subsp. intracellulare MTCC 9506]
MTGEPLPPVLAATAAAQRAGDLGAGQVAVIRKFYHQLPGWVSAAAREFAEAQLAGFGTQFGPEHLKELARGLTDALNPDGVFTDEDRARSRGVTLGNQRPDGMSELRGLITPELRATLEAVEAKLGAPGMCNPLDDIPCVDGTPSQEAIDRDTRSAAQRGHDALLAALRALLASGKLGQHNGLPASIIVTTTLAELEAAAGRALTGGGTILPMSEVIRLARHAHHYLAIFDKGKALALYHTKRLASPGTTNRVVRQGPRLHRPGLHRVGLLLRSPPHHRLQHLSQHRHQPAHFRLRPPSPHARPRRLDHPQKHPRRHRMETPTPPRARPTPHQHLPPPRTIPELRRRRRPGLTLRQHVIE